jgi:putative serine protease PepD
MEELNKTQIVLLCLLVSFVTSIGTGIITTSLLREVPQNVTQTINRVVERTVETVAPQVTTNTNTVTREVTVVVKEEDLVIDSIKKSRNSLVRVTKTSGTGSSAVSTVQTVGVIVKSDGTVLTDKRFVDNGASYFVTMPTGEVLSFKIAGTSEKGNAAFLAPILKETKTYAPITMSRSENPQLGQTVIAVGGKEKEAVAIGRINSLGNENVTTSGSGNATSTTSSVVSAIETDTPLRDSVAGSILLNLNGEMIGFENYDRATGQEDLYSAIGSIRREKPSFFE